MDVTNSEVDPQQNPNENSPTRLLMPNQKGIFLIALGIVFLLLVAGVGIYFFAAKGGSPQQNNVIVTPTQQPSNQTTKEAVTSGEERLLYAENGFSFYYPRSLELSQAFLEDNFWRSEYTPGNYVDASLILRSSDKPLPQLVKDGQFNIYIKTYPAEAKPVTIQSVEETPVTLGDKQTKMYTISCGVDCYYHVVRFSSNNNNYELIAEGAGGGLLSRFQNILSSFTFYDANSKEWRTYTSKEGAYTLKYPPDATFLEKVYTSVDGVRGYNSKLITIIPQRAGPIEGAFTVSFETIGTVTLDEYLKKNQCETIYENRRFTLNNEQAVYQSTACGIVGSSDVHVKHNNFLYSIGATPESPILATFKFTN